MWRNGTGHRAVRSSGPRSHASGQDNANKTQKESKNLMATMMEAQASHGADEAKRQESTLALQAQKKQMRLNGMRANLAVIADAPRGPPRAGQAIIMGGAPPPPAPQPVVAAPAAAAAAAATEAKKE